MNIDAQLPNIIGNIEDRLIIDNRPQLACEDRPDETMGNTEFKDITPKLVRAGRRGASKAR